MTTFAQRSITTNPRRVNISKILDIASPNATGSVERVNVNDIQAGPYQRPIRQAHIRRMVREWNPAQAGWIYVSRHANGALYVIDGQHRVEAVKTLQGKIGPYLDAIVVDGLSSTEEAEFFHFTQNPVHRAPLTPEDIHNAAVYAGDEKALQIQAIAEADGFRLSIRNDDQNPDTGQIRAVQAVYDIHDKYGPKTLALTLRMIRAAWGTHCYPSLPILNGTALFLAMYPQADMNALMAAAKRMGETPIDEWLSSARTHARTERMTNSEAVAYKVRAAYNWRRRTNSLPDFADTLMTHRATIRSEAMVALRARVRAEKSQA